MESAAIEPVRVGTRRNTSPDRLVMVNLSVQPCEGWLNIVRAAGQPWEEVLDNLAKAKALLQAKPEVHVLICYDVPEDQIATEIDNGLEPSQALANWQNETEALLTLYRQYYRRMTLVAHSALYDQPKELFAQLSARSGISLSSVDLASPIQLADRESHERLLPTQRLLALQVLQHPPAKHLAQELVACSLPLIETVSLFDLVDSLHDTYRQLSTDTPTGNSEENSKLHESLQDLQQENNLLIEQLRIVQQELEQRLLGGQNSTEKLGKLEKEVKRQNEKLRDVSQKNKGLEAQLKTAKQELKALRNSKSWKVTAPLRKCMYLLGGKKGGAA